MRFDQFQDLKELLADAEEFRVYSFNQGDDFAIWSKGGVCDAISIDWIRRYLISKKKRFDDPKYEAGFFYNSPGRQKLGTKHILLSHLYRDAKEEARSNLPKGSTQWSGEAFHKLAKGYHSNEARASRKAAKQATANESGLERLQAKIAGKPVSDPIRANRLGLLMGYIKTLDQNSEGQDAGIMINLIDPADNAGNGHSVAGVISAGNFKFFDPNVGEYSFSERMDLWAEFAEALWMNKYPELPSIYVIYITLPP